MYSRVLTLAYCVLTPLHVGLGRSSGRIDLVVQRDPHGFPVIYSTSVKGAIKSMLYKCGSSLYELLGGEVNFNVSEKESIVVFTDSYLFAFPIKIDGSFIYITSPYLLKNIINILDLSSHGFKNSVQRIYDSVKNVESYAIYLGSRETFYICTNDLCLEVRSRQIDLDDIFCSLPYPMNKISRSLIVVPDSFLLNVLSQGLITHTRIAVDYHVKRPRRGCLWTEEYVPMGTLFIGAMLIRSKDHIYDNIHTGDLEDKYDENVRSLIDLFKNGITVSLGGKETIGKGIVKIIAI